jgi:hypothetical protein
MHLQCPHSFSASVIQWCHGLVAFEIVAGELEGVHPFCRTGDLRTEEEL